MRNLEKDFDVVAGLYCATKSIDGLPIVQDVSLEVSPGEIVIITGESGSGKSTTMRMLAGIEKPDSGHAELFRQNLNHLSQTEQDMLISSRVGIGFQAPNLDTNLTVRENLIGLAEATGRDVDIAVAAHVIGRLGLQNSLDKKANVLSGGEKLKVAFGRIILPQPELLLLDEPTYALDHDNKVNMFADIARACHDDGMSALIVSHDAELARAIADRELVMASGHLTTSR